MKRLLTVLIERIETLTFFFLIFAVNPLIIQCGDVHIIISIFLLVISILCLHSLLFAILDGSHLLTFTFTFTLTLILILIGRHCFIILLNQLLLIFRCNLLVGVGLLHGGHLIFRLTLLKVVCLIWRVTPPLLLISRDLFAFFLLFSLSLLVFSFVNLLLNSIRVCGVLPCCCWHLIHILLVWMFFFAFLRVSTSSSLFNSVWDLI